MNISPAGVNLIARFEGKRNAAYRDAVGVATIGYGHTHGVRMGMWWSDAQCLAMLRADTSAFATGVERLVRVPVSQNQFDALVSLAYNIGVIGLGSSTLLRKLNARDYAGARAQFGVWVKAGGRTLPGLVVRRRAEAALFGASSPNAHVLAVQRARLARVLTSRKRLRTGGIAAREAGPYGYLGRAMTATKARIRALKH